MVIFQGKSKSEGILADTGQPSVLWYFFIFILGFTSSFLFQCNIFYFFESVRKIVWMGKIIKVAENKGKKP